MDKKYTYSDIADALRSGDIEAVTEASIGFIACIVTNDAPSLCIAMLTLWQEGMTQESYNDRLERLEHELSSGGFARFRLHAGWEDRTLAVVVVYGIPPKRVRKIMAKYGFGHAVVVLPTTPWDVVLWSGEGQEQRIGPYGTESMMEAFSATRPGTALIGFKKPPSCMSEAWITPNTCTFYTVK